MFTGWPGSSSELTEENTVASVGPYALNIDRPLAHRSTNSGPAASPPVTTTRNTSKPPGSTDANAAGVTNACETRSSPNNRANSTPPYTSVGAITIVAPPQNANTNSNTDASKLVDANARTRDPTPTPNRLRSSSAMSASPRWVTTTPFGTPVEPDV